MKDLKELRNEIDKCDREIIALLEKRMNTVGTVAEYKYANSIEIFDGTREHLVFEKIEQNIKENKYLPYLKDIYYGIMNASKEYQKKIIQAHEENILSGRQTENISAKIKAGYQGIPGSYGEEALTCYSNGEAEAVSFKSFEDVVQAVNDGRIEYGILPVENSYTGSVTASLDLFNKYDIYISGEYILPVRHNLLAGKGTLMKDIKSVYSHEQGLLQCAEYLNKNPEWKQEIYINTAMAARMVSEDKGNNKGAIASKRAAQIYGLDILAENINGSASNSTRFLVIKNKFEENKDADKISIVFSLPHRSGTLFEALQLITKQNLNLLKIESRPSRKENWEYIFFLDFEGNIREERCKRALADIEKLTGTYRFLGNYVKDRKTI